MTYTNVNGYLIPNLTYKSGEQMEQLGKYGFLRRDYLKELIYVVRNKQVMVDSDLAMLYQVETKALNRAVKRNIKRFPEDFCFQLTTEEAESLKCQSGTSKIQESEKKDGRGGRRTLPYVFTEQGISMLASVLHSDVAINVSIGNRMATENDLALHSPLAILLG